MKLRLTGIRTNYGNGVELTFSTALDAHIDVFSGDVKTFQLSNEEYAKAPRLIIDGIYDVEVHIKDSGK